MSDDLLPLAPKDGLNVQRRRKAAKRQAHLDKGYLDWLHGWPCLICRVHGIEAHHEPSKSRDPAGWHDRKTLPLCDSHHRGRWGIHSLGVEGFQTKHGVDIEAEIAKLNAKYEEEHGNGSIR